MPLGKFEGVIKVQGDPRAGATVKAFKKSDDTRWGDPATTGLDGSFFIRGVTHGAEHYLLIEEPTGNWYPRVSSKRYPAVDSGPVRTPTTWNPSDKGSTVTLSNGNRDGTSNSPNGTVRTIYGTNRNKFYMEYTVTGDNVGLGIMLSTASMSNYVGSVVGSMAWYPNVGQIYHNGTPVTTYGTAFSPVGVNLAMAVDLDANTIRYYAGGVAVAAAYAFPFTVNAPVMLAACGSSGSVQGWSANFGQDTMTYGVPDGFYPGFGAP